MKKYIRTCLSLDEETINKINQLTWILTTPGTKSGIVKEAINLLYNHIGDWRTKK